MIQFSYTEWNFFKGLLVVVKHEIFWVMRPIMQYLSTFIKSGQSTQSTFSSCSSDLWQSSRILCLSCLRALLPVTFPVRWLDVQNSSLIREGFIIICELIAIFHTLCSSNRTLWMALMSLPMERMVKLPLTIFFHPRHLKLQFGRMRHLH